MLSRRWGRDVKRLRAVLLGAGAIGKQHARVLSELPGVELVGIADPQQAGRSVAGLNVVSDLNDLLELQVDYAVIATPTQTHHQLGSICADAGVHALIEKPVAPESKAARALVETFSRAGLVGAVGHIERYNPSLQEARRRISAGQLGRVVQVATRRQGPFSSRITDVGVVMDLGTHDIDLTAWVTGERYARVSAVVAYRTGRSHEDMISVSAQLADGAIATHLVNWLSPFKERTVVITGEEGAFVADTLTADLTFHANGVNPAAWDEMTSFRGVQLGDVVRYAIPRPEPLRVEHEAFRDAVLGRGGDIVTLEEGLRVVEVAEAILTSAREGATIDLSGTGA
jgi:UDP-N-acetylglucosamine 3-dehydrogenase